MLQCAAVEVARRWRGGRVGSAMAQSVGLPQGVGRAPGGGDWAAGLGWRETTLDTIM